VAVTKIDEFMTKIGGKGGMSLTTAFDVEFAFGPKSTIPSYYDNKNKPIVTMMCDEAQLPNVQSAVAQRTGRYLGEGPVSYPHTRIFTDLSLGFMLDADLTPLKFFNSWYNDIFGEGAKSHKPTMEGALSGTSLPSNRVNKLKYPEQYTCTAKILKTEMGPKASNSRVPIAYYLEKCYPYSIDAVPLAYGSSQITRVTVNFYYSRHTVSFGE